jgi:hypothetical protein
MDAPDADGWKANLTAAVDLLDHATGGPMPTPRLGGGTVLMFRFGHRVSRDIDLIVDDVQWLGRVRPRLNDAVEARVLDYVEQANTLKLVLPTGVTPDRGHFATVRAFVARGGA